MKFDPNNPQPPDPNTEEGKKIIEATKGLYESVGKLVVYFSVIETSLFTFLGSLWHVPLPVAKALYSDLRVDAAISTARRLVAARQQEFGENWIEKEIERWMDYTFTQLATINGIRNHIVHHGVMGMRDIENPVVTNRMRARAEFHVKEISISRQEVDAMQEDLGGIVIILAVIGTVPLRPQMAIEAFEQLKKVPPWKYKSPLQGGKKDKGQNKAPNPPPTPQASTA